MRRVLITTVVAIHLLWPNLASCDDFPAVYNNDTQTDAEPMVAQTAAAQWPVPDGFRAQVFAQEPEVQNPIAMAWDPRGRIWIAENYTYADSTQQFDLNLRDRVLILEDTDGDGDADKRTVFTDQVQMLTSVEVGHGGVWLMCSPRLLFIPDRNHDDQPDGPAITVLDGFEVAKENYHNFANGLRWGPDGWLYGRCGGSCPGRIGKPGTPDDRRVALEGGIWRFHPQTSQFEVLTHGTTNPWGHDWNEWGDGFFINTVNGHLWHLIPGTHLHRPFTLDPNPHVYELLDMHADHWHFDTGSTWQKSRDGSADSYGGGHAHCGAMIYLGDNWPQTYRGNLFTWNIHGQRANQEIIERDGSGYVAKHGPDILRSVDPFFRGMDMSYGPDGAVYVIDWSDTGECHEHTGVHRTSGRVFRIAYGDDSSKLTPNTDLRSLTDRQLAKLMSHRNEWFPRQARSVLIERSTNAGNDLTNGIDVLRQLADGPDAIVAYRSLVTLHAVGAADRDFLRNKLSHDDEHIRAWAIRLLTDHWPLDDIFGPVKLTDKQSGRVDAESRVLLEKLCNMAEHDESGLVRLALASTLQRLPVGLRATLAERLVSRSEDAGDHNLPLLVWHGLIPVAEADPDALAGVAIASRWPKTQRLIARRLAETIDDNRPAMEMLLDYVATAGAAVRHNLLAGISDGLKGWSQAKQPKNWDRVTAKVFGNADQSTQAIIRDLSVLFGDGRALDEVVRIVQDKDADSGIRRSALATLVNSGSSQINEICLSVLDDPRFNVVAARGLARSSEPVVAQQLIKHYKRFRAPTRPHVIEILVSRPTFAFALLDAIAMNKIAVGDLTAFDVRQIRSHNNAALQKRVSQTWGEVRQSSQAKRQYIGALKRDLLPAAIAAADPSQGRRLFEQSCAKCHKLFGQGEAIGPDLTGAQRNNLDYLLENIVDPSAVVSKDFRMTVVVTNDGRVLNGLVLSKNKTALTLQTQTEKQTIRLSNVDELRVTTESPMPAGLLDNLSAEQIRNLIAYLMQATQVKLPQ